jgi:hypothetical protein
MNNLNSKSVIELKSIAKSIGIKGYFKLKKDELINIILSKSPERLLVREDSPPQIQTNYIETKIKLKQYLDSSRSNKIHVKNIMKLSTLKEAHIYCKYNNLSGQFTGPVIEKYIKMKYKMLKNKPSLCNGDLKCNETDIEIKSSNGGKENDKFNFVQLRMNHNCGYILSTYYLNYDNLNNLGDLYLFRLDKENMKTLILKYGNYAHGTISKLGEITLKDLNDVKNQKEYSLRPKYGDKCWNELLQFKIDEIIV